MYADVFSARRPITAASFILCPRSRTPESPMSRACLFRFESSSNRSCATAAKIPIRPPDPNRQKLANWRPDEKRESEIPFSVARVVLQDFTGVPLLADLAAMRDAAAKAGKNPKSIEPVAPVDLVVDHSVQVDFARPRRRRQTQYGNRIRAQPRALSIPQMGRARFRRLARRSARNRHRPPSQSRTPRARRFFPRRRFLSGFARRRGFAHHDD